MAAMEQTDPDNNVLFEKIGWGQWAVRKVDSDYIVTEGTEGTSGSPLALQDEEINKKLLSVHDLRNQTGVKLGWTKKQQQQQQVQALPQLMSPPHNQAYQLLPPILPPIQHRRKLSNGGHANLQAAAALRRESISASKQNLHNIKLPQDVSNAIESDLEDDYALADEIDDDSDSETDIESDEVVNNEEGTMFSFDDDVNAGQTSIGKFKPRAASTSTVGSKSSRRRSSMKSPPPGAIKFANRVPMKVSPPPGTPRDNGNGGGRRKSSSSAGTPGISKYSYNQRTLFFNRSRLNSLENLDNYIVSSAKNSGSSLSSPAPPHHQSSSLAGPTGSFSLSSLPWSANNYIHHAASPDSIAATMAMGRRKSSFNESHVRSTLSSSLPKQQFDKPILPPTTTNSLVKPYEHQNHSKSSNSVYSNKALTRERLAGEHSDTDEEDWATIGAESLRSGKIQNKRNINNNNINSNGSNDHSMSNDQPLSPSQAEERNAAYALVDLMSV